MIPVIRLSEHVVILIQTADQLQIGAASRWVDGWDRTIKKAKKVEANIEQ